MRIYYKHADFFCLDISLLSRCCFADTQYVSLAERKTQQEIAGHFFPAATSKKRIYLYIRSQYVALVSLELSM